MKVEESVNVTSNGALPVVPGLTVKEAIGKNGAQAADTPDTHRHRSRTPAIIQIREFDFISDVSKLFH